MAQMGFNAMLHGLYGYGETVKIVTAVLGKTIQNVYESGDELLIRFTDNSGIGL
tara:strand:+ start:3624 stop:3785 length:162 start_codon:yes stop_codon:yes gene_type:complete